MCVLSEGENGCVSWSSFRHTFRRYLTNRHFGNWSYRHLVCRKGMAVRREQRRRRPVWPLIGQAVDESVVAVNVEHECELVAVVLPYSMGQPNVDGLAQLGQLPSALDMVHIFCFTKRRKIQCFDSTMKKKIWSVFVVVLLNSCYVLDEG